MTVLRRHHGGVVQIIAGQFKLCFHAFNCRFRLFDRGFLLLQFGHSFDHARIYAVHLRFIDQPRALRFRFCFFHAGFLDVHLREPFLRFFLWTSALFCEARVQLILVLRVFYFAFQPIYFRSRGVLIGLTYEYVLFGRNQPGLALFNPRLGRRYSPLSSGKLPL